MVYPRVSHNCLTVFITAAISCVGVDHSWGVAMSQLVVHLRLLASHTTLWSAVHPSLASHSWLRELTAHTADQVKAMGHHSSSMLQVNSHY